ncbi:hypothetical protein CNR22_03480 [Sphingobacteriaceae bacterium]|nr:hypothetical protein CNR22_03480 [Sphingobacteriaceae bacterium]
MIQKITFLVFVVFICLKSQAQAYSPIATSGYTLDAIAENTTAVLTTGATLDGVNVMYSAAYAALVSSSYGLPNNGTLSSSTKTFQLQNYTGSNLLFVPHAAQDSLTFISPVACQSVSILNFATDAFSPTTMSVTVRFTDNSTQTFSSVTVYDWLYTGATAFVNGFDRLNRSNDTPANEGGNGNPRFFATDFPILCANQGKQIKRLIFKNTGGSSEKIGILAVSGVQVPLTASVSPANLCTSGGSATLTAGGVSNYTWLPAGNFAGATTTVVSVTPGVTTEFTVQAVNSQSCTYNAMVTVNVFSTVPTLTVTSTAPSGGICPTKTVMLTASGATTYSWTGGASTVTNGVAFAPSTTTDYTVTGANACGTSTAVSSVSVFPLPIVIAVASTPSLCSGAALTLTTTGSNASTYTWTGGFTSGTSFSPALTSTYVVRGTSALNCTASAAVVVSVVTTPTLAPTSSSLINCIGNSFTLTATGASNYTWTSATQTVFTPTMLSTPANTGITSYTVTKSNANCLDTKIISITTNSLPVVFAIANPTQVCAGKPATLTVAGGQTYVWTSPGAPPTVASFTFSGASPLAFPPIPTTYTVAANDGTCVAATTVFVHADPNPTIITSAAPATLCSGSTTTINANGGISYTITSSATSATFAVFPVIETLTTTSAYLISGNNSFGCITSTSQIVQVYGNPTLTAVPLKTLVCSGGSVQINASGANTYLWSSGAATSSAVVNPVNAISGPVIFTVTGTFTNTLCYTEKTVAVSVFIPTITVSGNTSACNGGDINLIASGASQNKYTWYTVPGGAPTSTVSQLIIPITAPAVYTISILTTSSTASLCPATKTINVNLYLNPVITATAQRTQICAKESVILHGVGGDTYVWNTGFNTPTINVSPSGTTNYTVTGTDTNGCIGTATIQIKVSSCTGVADLTASNLGLKVYPNPNNGQFTIQSDSDLKLDLLNELGQVIRVIELSAENNYRVSLDVLDKGLYVLRGLNNTNTFYTGKIVVAE